MTIADDQSQLGTAADAAPVLPVLRVDPLDTDGRLLRLQPGPTAHVAVASRFVRLDTAMARLDILSASHRVMMASMPLGTLAASDGWDVHETVACGSAAEAVLPDRLPTAHEWEAGGWSMSFTSSLSTDLDELHRAADRLAAGADHPATLVASFPGHPLAITGLSVHERSSGVEWRSWHLYPGDDPHMVTTTTVATRPCQETLAQETQP